MFEELSVNFVLATSRITAMYNAIWDKKLSKYFLGDNSEDFGFSACDTLPSRTVKLVHFLPGCTRCIKNIAIMGLCISLALLITYPIGMLLIQLYCESYKTSQIT
ncbi:hypothetical protein TSAR_010748 [Trichomalopsis sarcophagae]|uniref:Uncharacterized protein n=1 Tax=Trichomalopsis sarcophagae TaxID=543379 RepID=A0A232EZP3_9HYME|nr:hypothetical protein TSAR_010748 [Trichomalopsis sarcophagae]